MIRAQNCRLGLRFRRRPFSWFTLAFLTGSLRLFRLRLLNGSAPTLGHLIT